MGKAVGGGWKVVRLGWGEVKEDRGGGDGDSGRVVVAVVVVVVGYGWSRQMQKLYSSLRLRGVFSGLVKFGFVSLNAVFLLQTRARHKVSSFLFFCFVFFLGFLLVLFLYLFTAQYTLSI